MVRRKGGVRSGVSFSGDDDFPLAGGSVAYFHRSQGCRLPLPATPSQESRSSWFPPEGFRWAAGHRGTLGELKVSGESMRGFNVLLWQKAPRVWRSYPMSRCPSSTRSRPGWIRKTNSIARAARTWRGESSEKVENRRSGRDPSLKRKERMQAMSSRAAGIWMKLVGVGGSGTRPAWWAVGRRGPRPGPQRTGRQDSSRPRETSCSSSFPTRIGDTKESPIQNRSDASKHRPNDQRCGAQPDFIVFTGDLTHQDRRTPSERRGDGRIQADRRCPQGEKCDVFSRASTMPAPTAARLFGSISAKRTTPSIQGYSLRGARQRVRSSGRSRREQMAWLEQT